MNLKSLLFCILPAGLLVAVAATSSAQITFSATNTVSTGTTPVSVIAADVNGDGKPDLISANFAASTIEVFTNNGGGIFGSNGVYAAGPAGASPYFVAAADVNGDGKIDLVTANYATNTLTVFTNNGKGVFGSNATLSVAISTPECLALADLNGDGKPDLVCANGNNQNTLVVFFNNGSGDFTINATYGVGNGLQYVVAADINGDGHTDLISANYNDSTLTILTNDSTGYFPQNITVSVGTNPVAVAVADVNGDGKPDLISANATAKTLTVLTNRGFGNFGSNATINLVSSPTSLIAADLNGDGKPDLACTEANNSIQIFTNNGSGIFGSNTTITVAGIPQSLITADVNSDGVADFVTADRNLNLLTVLTQTGLARPLLKINHPSASSILLSWISSSTNFVLQTNNNLLTTNWLPANLTVNTSSGTNQSATLSPAPPGKLFFRLKQ